MNTKIIFLALIVATFFIGCNKETHDNLVYNLNEPDTLTADDYKIYNLIAHPQIPKGEIIFIYQKTIFTYLDTSLLKEVDGMDNSLIQNYYSKRDIELYLNEDSFSYDNNVILVPVNVNDNAIFNEIYNSPKVRVLSNIGYNENFTQAIVGAEDGSGGCSFYYNYYLKKENNNWFIKWNCHYAQCPIK
jgi:hypothetical protein